MWKYATRRVLTMIPILIGVSMVVFLLVASLPGDAVDAHAGGNITAEKTGGVVAAFEHLFHLGAGVGADSIFVVEHAGDGGDRDSGFPCNIVNIHRPSCKIRCGWMVKTYPAAVWL